MARFTFDIPDADLDALSEQFEARIPRATDDDGAFTETASEHATRAIQEWIDELRTHEVRAARVRVAEAAVDEATTDAERQQRLLAAYRARRA